jgi:hypothetical protein
MTRCRRLGGITLLAGALSGCVASGAIKGRLTDPGQTAVPVTLDYRSERFDEGGVMTATMPDGERFSGRYLQVTSQTEGATLDPYWGGWEMGWGSWGGFADGGTDEVWIGGADMPTFMQNYSGKVIATLLGDRGHRIRCRFRLANPSQGMSSGGIGECQVSGGGKIDATF